MRGQDQNWVTADQITQLIRTARLRRRMQKQYERWDKGQKDQKGQEIKADYLVPLKKALCRSQR